MAEKKYGHFDDANREYVITDPKTPWPWINYLGNEDFFSLISNTAGGYSFYKDAKFRDGEYYIVVKNPEGREKGVKKITADGKAIAGNIIPCLEGKHEVVVEM